MKYTTIFFISVFILMGCMIYSHEKVHQHIYSFYGIESKMSFDVFTNGSANPFFDLNTKPERGCPNEACELAQHQNEIFGYVFFPFVAVISIGLFIIISIMEDRHNSTRK